MAANEVSACSDMNSTNERWGSDPIIEFVVAYFVGALVFVATIVVIALGIQYLLVPMCREISRIRLVRADVPRAQAVPGQGPVMVVSPSAPAGELQFAPISYTAVDREYDRR